MTGTLYLIATPIGNLEDMTPRGLKLLAAADIIAAEDTRHTLQLLNHFDLKGRLVSYHEHNKDKAGPQLLEELLAGQNIALVSDAGFPGIADPGEALVKLAVAAGVTVVPVPGANAALTALVASGLPSSPFFFGGFLPKSKRNRKEQLAAWQYLPATVVLYEAPHRIVEVLGEILAAWGDRPLTLGRELTKLHEEFWRGTVSGALAHLKEYPPRGEFVLVLGQGEPPPEQEEERDPLEEVQQLLESGMEKKAALQQVAKAHKIPKRELYNKLIQLQQASEQGEAPLQNTEEEGF
jgi:16S rRNA (cytidine1402-2'-O)-methyltransferase